MIVHASESALPIMNTNNASHHCPTSRSMRSQFGSRHTHDQSYISREHLRFQLVYRSQYKLHDLDLYRCRGCSPVTVPIGAGLPMYTAYYTYPCSAGWHAAEHRSCHFSFLAYEA